MWLTGLCRGLPKSGAGPLDFDRPIAPVIAAFLSAVLWGIWWIPIRYLESLGMDGAWGSAVMNAGAFLAALVWMVLWRAPVPD